MFELLVIVGVAIVAKRLWRAWRNDRALKRMWGDAPWRYKR